MTSLISLIGLEKKIYVVKKCVGKIFLKFFSLNLILIHILDSFYHFQSFLYHKNCAYLKEVIRWDFDQCETVLDVVNGKKKMFFG